MKSLNDLTLIAQQPFATTVHQEFHPPTSKEIQQVSVFRFFAGALICLGLLGFAYVVVSTFSAHNVSFFNVFSGPKIVLSQQESLRMICGVCMVFICALFALHFVTLSNITKMAHISWQRDRFIAWNFSPSGECIADFKTAAMELYDGVKQLDANELIVLKNTDGIQEWAKCIVEAELARRNL